MASVLFFSEGISFKLSNHRKTANWLNNISRLEKRKIESLSYIFCSDSYLLLLNQLYLKHSYYTDTLSFDYSERAKINGEIYVSIQRVKDNAGKYKQPFETELRRVMAHGLLHFLGYRDKSPRQKAQMRRKEEACLSLWK